MQIENTSKQEHESVSQIVSPDSKPLHAPAIWCARSILAMEWGDSVRC